MVQLSWSGAVQLPQGKIFEVRLSTLTSDLDGAQQITEGGGFNKVVGYFKSLTDVTVWVRANLPSDAQNFEHFIDLDILLAEFENQEWAVSKYEINMFMLIEWSAWWSSRWWWRCFKGPLQRTGFHPMRKIIFLIRQLPNSGIMVTVRGEFCPEPKRVSSAMKRQPVNHLIMSLYTMHKQDLCTTIWSPKLLISSRNCPRWWIICIIGFSWSALVLKVPTKRQGTRTEILWQLL